MNPRLLLPIAVVASAIVFVARPWGGSPSELPELSQFADRNAGTTSRMRAPIANADFKATRFDRVPAIVASPLASQGEERVVVRVLDAAGRPLPEASVTLQDPTTRIAAATTDATGGASFEGIAQELDDLQVAVESRDYESRVVDVPRPVTGELVVRLSLGSSLSGMVVWEDGRAVGAGVTVLAWPSGYGPEAQDARAHLSGSRREAVRTTRTDEEGRFVLDGLPATGRWVVSAAGRGALRVKYEVARFPLADAITVVAHHCYAVGVRARSQDGADLRTSPELFGEGSGFAFRGHEGEWIGPHEVLHEMAALGFPDDLVRSDRARDERLLLASYPTDQGDSVEVSYGVSVPGYRAGWTQVRAERLAESLPVHVLELDSTATGFGTLDVRLGGPAFGLLGGLGDTRPFGELRLRNVETGEITLLYLERGRGAVHRFEAIPEGDYLARLSVYEGGAQYPDPDEAAIGVSIAQESAGQLDFDVRDTGSLQLLLVQEDGNDYEGRAGFTLIERESRRMVTNYFDGAPYGIEGVPPGEYELRFDSIPGVDLAQLGRPVVFVGENQAHYEELRIPR